jgi:hypothetical protein
MDLIGSLSFLYSIRLVDRFPNSGDNARFIGDTLPCPCSAKPLSAAGGSLALRKMELGSDLIGVVVFDVVYCFVGVVMVVVILVVGPPREGLRLVYCCS